MIINKIINNNIISSLDDNGSEIIVMGRGIAYQKAKGDPVTESDIEKVFTLQAAGQRDKFTQLIESIPPDIIELTGEIIDYAKSQLSRKLNDVLYITLIDHIHFAVERYLQGITPPNAMIWEIKQFYKEEMRVALEAVRMINSKLMIDLGEDEAGFIALHFVNAELNSEMQDVKKITKIIHEILNIVKYTFRLEFDQNSLQYFRFVTHLKFFSQRVLMNTIEMRKDDALFSIVIERYPNAYRCVTAIKKHLEQVYGHDLSSAEQLYLIMHIARIVDE